MKFFNIINVVVDPIPHRCSVHITSFNGMENIKRENKESICFFFFCLSILLCIEPDGAFLE